MISFFIQNLLFTEGIVIFWAIALLSLIALLFFRPLLYLSVFFFAFSLYFFRNPDRMCLPALSDENVIICPADGRVVDVQQGDFNGYAQRVSIFLSPLDVHVQWAPFTGVAQDIIYKKGTFSMAFLPKSSELNERNDVVFVDERQRSIVVRQIAGTIARRICCWISSGDSVVAGDKYGMIRFGSRVEIFLPAKVHISVQKSERVYGGQTVLGSFTS